MIKIDKKIKKVSLKKKKEVEEQDEIILTDVKLPEDAPARMKTLKSEGKKWYLTVVCHPGTERPFALFCHTNNKEKTVQTSDATDRLRELARRKGILEKYIESNIEKCKAEPNISKLTRTISLCLRHGIAIKNIVAELDKMEDIFVGSFLFQIKKFLGQYIAEGEEAHGEICPECGETLVFSEGCLGCMSCGYSKCS